MFLIITRIKLKRMFLIITIINVRSQDRQELRLRLYLFTTTKMSGPLIMSELITPTLSKHIYVKHVLSDAFPTLMVAKGKQWKTLNNFLTYL